MAAVSDLLDQALAYAARGWSIIPVAGKKPTGIKGWTHYQTERPSDEDLCQWFWCGRATGLAVICGPVSGGLTCRDFDTETGYQRWAEQYPELAEILPTVKTGRGFHVYFTSDLERIITDDDDSYKGELRGSGYVLLPPSVHPSGLTYTWTVALPDGPLLAVDAAKAGLFPENGRAPDFPNASMKQREQRGQRQQKRTENTEAIGTVGRVELDQDEQLREIIASTLPKSEGQRNRALFELARTLKANPAYADAEPSDLERVVRLWHKAALPFITTKAFEDSWADFLYGWDKVIWPKGAFPMDAIFEQVRTSEPPAFAAKYETTECKQLASLVRELQRCTGDKPFFLSSRTAARLVGVKHLRAWKWLRMFQATGILREQEKGGQKSGRYRATRYFYVAGDDGESEAVTNPEPDCT